MSSTGQEKQEVRNISVENLSSVHGVKLIIEKLDKLKDENSPAYEVYEKYEKFSRPHQMSISGYVMKFEHQITESHKMEVLYGVLPYRILNNANLPEEKKKLLRATVNEMK